jgi:hypothetical protein
VVFFPIYILNKKHKLKAQIGVYEAEVAIATSLLDDEGDVDLTQLSDPLLFSYVDMTYLDKYGASGEDLSAKTMTPGVEEVDIVSDNDSDGDGDGDGDREDISKKGNGENKDKKKKKTKRRDDREDGEIDEDESDEDDDSDEEKDDEVFVFKKGTAEEELEKERKKEEKEPVLTFDTVFKKESHMPTLPTWPAETIEQAKESRREYRKTKNELDNWYVKMLKNKKYSVHQNEGAGDCFFATIRDSYTQLGYVTSVQKLRQYLSQEVDQNLFEQYSTIYKGVESEIKSLDHDLDKLQKTNVALKKQSDKTEKMEHQKDIIKEALHVKKEFHNAKTQREGATGLLEEFGFMENIRSVADLKTFVQTSEYWADIWALTMMEKLLKTKIIVIEKTDDPKQMLRCTESHIEDFDPVYYILVAYQGDRHYELVSYKDKKIFTFGELPFDIKKLVVDKCMERSTGVYNRIPAFRQFQTELGLEPSDFSSSAFSTDDSTATPEILYDPKLVLSFHARSDQRLHPGKVEADDIPTSKQNEFAVLAKIPSWRRRLHDTWVGGKDGELPAPFTSADGNRWSSVEHYLIAARFRESNPAVYVDFCAGTELGKNLENALASFAKKSKKNNVEGKYAEIGKKATKLEPGIRDAYRKEALIAKFSQNLDLKEMLKETKMAKLQQYRQGDVPFVDTALMEVRASFFV